MELYNMPQLAQLIADGTDNDIVIEPFSFRRGYLNELLFFLKPETFLVPRHIRTRIVKMVLEKFEEYQVYISGVMAVKGETLAKYGIMDRHYGFINRLSKEASRLIKLEDLRPVLDDLGIDPSKDSPKILGGHEFLYTFRQYTPETLNELWLAKRSLRVKSGFYVRRCEIDGTDVILVNGFHPLQLFHYTAPHHRTVIFLLHSNTPWRTLREQMVGDTYPDRALGGSIRNILYDDKELQRWIKVSIANNFVHLSAGPFEALFEIYNFLSPFINFSPSDTNIGRSILERGLPKEIIRCVLYNPKIKEGQTEEHLFSMTEGMDTPEAIDLLIRHYNKELEERCHESVYS